MKLERYDRQYDECSEKRLCDRNHDTGVCRYQVPWHGRDGGGGEKGFFVLITRFVWTFNGTIGVRYEKQRIYPGGKRLTLYTVYLSWFIHCERKHTRSRA